MSSFVVDNICKSDNEFSFLSTIVDLVGNRQYKNGAFDALCSDYIYNRNQYSDLWISLSAIGLKIGGIFLLNINNFIDNLLNIETCGIKGLQSLALIIGTDYNIFNTVNNFPIEIYKLLEIFSMKKEYLANSRYVNYRLSKQVEEIASSYCSSNVCAVLSIEDFRSKLCELCAGSSVTEGERLKFLSISAEWDSYSTLSSIRIDLSAIDDAISATFYSFINNKLSTTYNDVSNTIIYKDLSAEILKDNFNIPNEYDDDIEKIRVQYSVSHNFNVEDEADNIDQGLSTLSDYTIAELNMLDFEFLHRHDPFDPLLLSTRYAYYKQIQVKEYFEFILNYYLKLDQSYLSATQYDVDENYFLLSTEYEKNKTILNDDCTLKDEWILLISKDLALFATSLREIREQLKIFCQKNFMKGTFLLISYVINEYLKSNTLASLKKLKVLDSSNFNDSQIKFDSNTNYSELIEYLDPVNYFNISALQSTTLTSTDLLSDDGTNPRYWEVNSTVKATGAIDTTDIFTVPPTVQANVFAFDLLLLSAFYYKIMNMNFKKYELRDLSGMSYTSHLSKFLSEIFDVGADNMYKDDNGKIVYEVEDPALGPYKEDLYFRYTADSDGELPYYYYTNTVHPSYQIHPYLSSFMEKVDYSYPIENIATIVQDEIISLVKSNIDLYIDEDGYLINMWKNPLGANQDYLSHYEKADHIDETNAENPVFGYDGLFYPTAISYLKNDNDFKTMIKLLNQNKISATSLSENIVTNFYYGLDLTTNEIKTLSSQLSTLRSYLSAIAFSKETVIYRYGLDLYGNAYILVKDKTADDTYKTLREKQGVLFVRKKNLPIAFPAFITDNKKSAECALNTDISFFYAENSTGSIYNNAIYTVSEKIQLTNDIYSPNFKDFYISIDKQDIAFVLKICINNVTIENCITLATISKNYDSLKQVYNFSLDKVDSEDEEYLYKDTTITSFGCFTTINNKIAVIMYKQDENTVTIDGSKYNYDSSQIIEGFNSKPINISIKSGTDIALDADEDMLILAYVSNSSLSNVKNYIGKLFDYNDDDSYGTYLTRRLGNTIATRVFKIQKSFNEINVESDTVTDDLKTSYYNTYTDCGFFGLFDNDINDNDINDKVNDMHYSTLCTDFEETVGMLKFLLIGKQKTGNGKMIDFKLCLPVRMFEGFSATYNIANNLIKYDYAHFGENVLKSNISGDGDPCSPSTVDKILNGIDANLMLDQQYFNFMSANSSLDSKFNRLYKNLTTPPYLYYSDAGFPMLYYDPGCLTGQTSADEDNFIFNINGNEVSCSWQKESESDIIKLDFNTLLYNNLISVSNATHNYFNEKRCFLHLDYVGEAGYLNLYKKDSSGKITFDGDDGYFLTYYIKNISDLHPKFIVAKMTEAIPDTTYLAYNIKSYSGNVILLFDNETSGKIILTI